MDESVVNEVVETVDAIPEVEVEVTEAIEPKRKFSMSGIGEAVVAGLIINGVCVASDKLFRAAGRFVGKKVTAIKEAHAEKKALKEAAKAAETEESEVVEEVEVTEE